MERESHTQEQIIAILKCPTSDRGDLKTLRFHQTIIILNQRDAKTTIFLISSWRVAGHAPVPR
jgi:hypothetical protein